MHHVRHDAKNQRTQDSSKLKQNINQKTTYKGPSFKETKALLAVCFLHEQVEEKRFTD